MCEQAGKNENDECDGREKSMWHIGNRFAFCYQEFRIAADYVRPDLSCSRTLTQNHTLGFAWRIRIIAPPKPREFDEYSVAHFEVGRIYEVSSRLATLLILGGYAEPVNAAGEDLAEAADKPYKP